NEAEKWREDREDNERWRKQIRAHFPDWGTDAASPRWPSVRSGLRVGETVSGTVIARAPFGVWLDIGASFPALLLVPNMSGARERRITMADYPSLGTQIEGRINALGDRGEIGVSQQYPDDMIEGTE
ncbi:MAG TPA: hypothetical protein PK867_07425, partial [Pirellulales bacterium]|nr:hypothetical protein [Pirellulales bacterium]